MTGTINFLMNGGSSAILVGSQGYFRAPFNMVITKWQMVGTPTGTLDLDVQIGREHV